MTLERNNAFAVVDLVAERVTDILPLGFKNNALPGKGLDASDMDGRIRIKPWQLRSWYEPDYLAAFTTIAGTFLVTANEGDPRDFSGYTEVARVADLPLDPVAFPNWATLQLPQNLGRLQVSRLDGMNASGQFTKLYAFGGRSLAVWTTRGELLADTGDAFERLMAAAVPRFFNVRRRQQHFRSDQPRARPRARAARRRDDRWPKLRLRGLRADRRDHGVRHHRSPAIRTSSSTSTTGTSPSIRPRSA